MNYLLNKYLPQIEFDSYEEFRKNFKINVPVNRKTHQYFFMDCSYSIYIASPKEKKR